MSGSEGRYRRIRNLVERRTRRFSFSAFFLCGANLVCPFAWRPIDRGQCDHVFRRSAEADTPRGDAEAFTCAVICPWGDAGAKCLGLHFGSYSFADSELGAQPGDCSVDLPRASRERPAGRPGTAARRAVGLLRGDRSSGPHRRDRTRGLLPDGDPVWLEAIVLGVKLGSSGEVRSMA